MATRRRASQRSLTGSISDIQRRVKYLQNRQTPTRLGNQAVQRSAIQYRAVGTDQIALNSIVNDQIQANAIAQAQLRNNSVGRDEIINGEVVEAKLGTDAVTSTKIKDGEVITGKLGSAAVELLNMSPNSVANTQLTTDSVNFRTVATNAIGNENMLDNSVGNSELQNDSVGNGEMQNDSVGFAELRGSSVGTSTLQNGSVTRSKIGSGQVGSAQIQDGAITTLKYANDSITFFKISSGTRMSLGRLVEAGTGLSRAFTDTGSRLFVSFGTGSTTVARGDHGHGLIRTTSPNGQNSNVLSLHTHQVTVSSRRYKTDISNHFTEKLDSLLELQLKKYKYKKILRDAHAQANKEWFYGYIAEEVHELGLTEIVEYNKNGEPEALEYSMLSVLLLELVKRQQKEINELKDAVAKIGANNA